MARHLRNHTECDPLTKLSTRRFFRRRLRQEIDQARRKKRSLGLCVSGSDRFREINHTFGPRYGNALLRDVARRFARATNGSNAGARLGGDEYAALFPDVTAESPWGIKKAKTVPIKRKQRPFCAPISACKSRLFDSFPTY
jgi:diguanylate cyclase (GGDEF)-like protein